MTLASFSTEGWCFSEPVSFREKKVTGRPPWLRNAATASSDASRRASTHQQHGQMIVQFHV